MNVTTSESIRSLVAQLQDSVELPQKENFVFSYKLKTLLDMKIPSALKGVLEECLMKDNMFDAWDKEALYPLPQNVKYVSMQGVHNILAILNTPEYRRYEMTPEEREIMKNIAFEMTVMGGITENNYMRVLTKHKVADMKKVERDAVKKLVMKILIKDLPAVRRKFFARNIYNDIMAQELCERECLHISNEMSMLEKMMGIESSHKEEKGGEVEEIDFSKLINYCSWYLKRWKREEIHVLCEKIKIAFNIRKDKAPITSYLWKVYDTYITALESLMKKTLPYNTEEGEVIKE